MAWVRARVRARVGLRHGVALPYEPDLDKVAWLELGLGLGVSVRELGLGLALEV